MSWTSHSLILQKNNMAPAGHMSQSDFGISRGLLIGSLLENKDAKSRAGIRTGVNSRIYGAKSRTGFHTRAKFRTVFHTSAKSVPCGISHWCEIQSWILHLFIWKVTLWDPRLFYKVKICRSYINTRFTIKTKYIFSSTKSIYIILYFLTQNQILLHTLETKCR